MTIGPWWQLEHTPETRPNFTLVLAKTELGRGPKFTICASHCPKVIAAEITIEHLVEFASTTWSGCPAVGGCRALGPCTKSLVAANATSQRAPVTCLLLVMLSRTVDRVSFRTDTNYKKEDLAHLPEQIRAESWIS